MGGGVGRLPLKGKNLLLQEQILSLKSKLPFGRVLPCREANSKSQKLFPFAKMEVYPYSLTPHTMTDSNPSAPKKR